jgi:hypothetical protein
MMKVAIRAKTASRNPARRDPQGRRRAGCDWYIRYLLSKVEVSVVVHANPGVFDPERGLQMSLPEHSPFFSPTTGINKREVVRDDVEC